MNDDKVCTGQVVWFNKGIGFIAKDDGSGDIFVHYSGINSEGYKTLQKDQRVSFEVGQNNSGKPIAVKVTVLK